MFLFLMYREGAPLFAWMGQGMLVVFRADNAHVDAEQGLKHAWSEHLAWRALGYDTLFKADDVACVVGCHGEVMAYHDLGEAMRGTQVFQELAEKTFSFEIHAGGRFVEDEEFRLLLEGEGKEHPLHLAARQGADPAFHKMGCMDEFQKMGSLGSCPA